jgi:hypothetical protein
MPAWLSIEVGRRALWRLLHLGELALQHASIAPPVFLFEVPDP